MVSGGTRGIDTNPGFQRLACQQLPKHALGGGRPTDIAQADEQNLYRWMFHSNSLRSALGFIHANHRGPALHDARLRRQQDSTASLRRSHSRCGPRDTGRPMPPLTEAVVSILSTMHASKQCTHRSDPASRGRDQAMDAEPRCGAAQSSLGRRAHPPEKDRDGDYQKKQRRGYGQNRHCGNLRREALLHVSVDPGWHRRA